MEKEEARCAGESNRVRHLSVSSASHSRIPALDGFRALAILIVMASHAGLGRIIPGGFGVTLFFFLSGYLITTLLRLEMQATSKIDLVAFYKRRALRILPPFYIAIATSAVLVLAGAIPGAVSVSGIAVDVAFLSNYAGALGTSSASHIPLWSLDVEEHYYIIFPALFMAIRSYNGKASVPFILSMLCLAALASRALSWEMSDRSQIYYWSHTRIDSIIFGAILATWRNPAIDPIGWKPNAFYVLAALAIIIFTIVFRSEYFRETLRYSLQGMALLIVFSAGIQATGVMGALLNSVPLRYIALLSYSLYLIHIPMLKLFEPIGAPLSYIVAYVAAVLWAYLMYILIEKPLARRRKASLIRSLRPDPEVGDFSGQQGRSTALT